jgi:hypothetical protein
MEILAACPARRSFDDVRCRRYSGAPQLSLQTKSLFAWKVERIAVDVDDKCVGQIERMQFAGISAHAFGSATGLPVA